MCKQVRIRNTNQGEYFKMKNTDSSPVWIRGEYVRSEKKYSCHKFDDVNHERLITPGTSIFYWIYILT